MRGRSRGRRTETETETETGRGSEEKCALVSLLVLRVGDWAWWFVRERCSVGLAQRTIPYQTTTGVGSAGPRRVLDGCSEAGAELDSSRS